MTDDKKVPREAPDGWKKLEGTPEEQFKAVVDHVRKGKSAPKKAKKTASKPEKEAKPTDPVVMHRDVLPDDPLPDRAQAFAREYVKEPNGTQAAIKAGYSAKTAHAAATRLLKNVKVQGYMAKLKAPALESFKITRKRIMDEMAALAFSNVGDFITIEDGQAYIDIASVSKDKLRALSSFEVVELPPMETADGGVRQVLKVKIKTWDKVRALEALMKRYGMLKEKVEHGGKVDVNTSLDPENINDLAKRIAFVLSSAGKNKK